MKKTTMKQICLSVLAMVLTFVGILLQGQARVRADSGVDTIRLALDDTFQSGTIASKGANIYYRVTLPSDGWLTVSYQGWDIGKSYYQVSNAELTRDYGEWGVWGSSNQAPQTDSKELALEKGDYLIRIRPYDDCIGDYKLKASFVPARNNEKADNNEFTDAQPLASRKLVTAFLSLDDRMDFYQIQINSRQAVRIIYTARVRRSYLEVWNQDYTQRFREGIWGASETSPETYVYEEVLEPGAYYVKITPYDSDVGRYTLQMEAINPQHIH